MLLEFYAASGDFTRRLTSVKANSKFSAPDAGPEDYFSVRMQHLPGHCHHSSLSIPLYRACLAALRLLMCAAVLWLMSYEVALVSCVVQGRQEDLRSVVTSLRATFGVDYIYCWHGLPAYWSGISLEVRRVRTVV